MAVTEKLELFNEIRSDKDITRIFIADNEIMQVNLESAWKVDHILTDYRFGGGPPKELIVIFKRKEAEEGE